MVSLILLFLFVAPHFHLLGDAEEFLNTNDDRMNQVVYAGGLLYGGVNSLLPFQRSSRNESSVRVLLRPGSQTSSGRGVRSEAR